MIKKLGTYSTSATLAQGMMIIFTFITARALGPKQFGFLAGGYALAGLTTFAFNWGLDSWMLKDRKSLNAPREWSGYILKIKVILGLVWGICLVLGAPLIRPDIYSVGLMLVVGLDMWFDSALNTHIAALNIRGVFSTISGLLLFSRGVRLLGAVLLIASGVDQPLPFALVRLSGVVCGLIAAFAALRPTFSSARMPSFKQMLKESTPFGLSDLLVMVYMQADVSILVLMKGNTAAGLYSPASGLVNALFIIPATIFALLVPVLSRQSVSEPSRLKESLQRLTTGYFVLGLLLMLGVYFLGGWVIRWVLGPEYALTGFLLTIMSPLIFFKSLGFGWAAFLVASGRQNQRLIPQVVSAVLNVGLNLWMIPRLGIPGVALVYVVSEIVLTIGYGFLVYRKFNPVKLRSSEP